MTLIILHVADLAAALLGSLFEHPVRRFQSGVFLKICYVVRSPRPAGLFSFSLFDGLQLRLRRLHLREDPAASVSNSSRGFINNPG
jgi:hypothetical protein